MQIRLKHDGATIALPALQFFTLAAIVQTEPGAAWAAGFAFLIATGLWGWLRSVRIARLIVDTPTSRIASAAQGYVELHGHGKPLDGIPLVSPVNGLPVLWYRVDAERKQSDGKWHHVMTDESDASFLLDDGSGVCAIDPEGAEMMVSRREVYLQGDLRYTQRCLIARDPVYVLGDFATIGSISPDLDVSRQIGDLLAHWKTDRRQLLARFDLDGDGEIDLREWELARRQARREVVQRRDEALSAPEAHVVRKPTSNRLYLISDFAPDGLTKRYRRWSAYHLVVFLAATATTAWFWGPGGLLH